MSLSAPSPPNPYATAAAQQQTNNQAAIAQQQLNNVNQTTPYGSLTYTQTGTNADGIPIYSATTALNPAEQKLFDTGIGTQTQMAEDASKLATNLGSSLTSAPNLGNNALVNKMMGWQKDFMQPIFNNQNSNLNSQLANQGLAVGSGAYDNAQMQQAMNQNQAYESGMLQDQQTAYNQALQSYEAPIQTLGTLLGESQPGNVGSSLTSTPQGSIQPANLESLVQGNYQSQLQNYQNNVNGMFGIPAAVLGGWATSGFKIPSDVRLKRDIARVGTLNDGTPIYRYRYLGKPEMHIGVMAQDILGDKPDAVVMGDDGFYRVDYERATDASVGTPHG